MIPAGPLERHQVWLYLAVIAVGVAIGTLAPASGAALEVLILPLLGALLFVTFLQVPLARIPEAMRDARFLATVLVANFLVVPLVIAGLLLLVPDQPLLRAGIALVLVMPCTDWFLTFTHVARGDTARAVAITPVVLLVQLMLLPVYLTVFVGDTVRASVESGEVVRTFLILIVVPLAAAGVVQLIARRQTRARAMISGTAILPVPLLAFVLFLIAASQVGAVVGSLEVFPLLLGVFAGYLVLAVTLGLLLARLARLPLAASRTVVFSVSTRNSFVVLPIALALPEGAGLVAVVVVFQSLIELLGMAVLVWLVPRLTKESNRESQ